MLLLSTTLSEEVSRGGVIGSNIRKLYKTPSCQEPGLNGVPSLTVTESKDDRDRHGPSVSGADSVPDPEFKLRVAGCDTSTQFKRLACFYLSTPGLTAVHQSTFLQVSGCRGWATLNPVSL
jgi:hypothetical protein